MNETKKLPTIEIGDTVVFRTDLEAWVRYGETQLRQVMLDIILSKKNHVVKSVESDINAFNIEGDSGYFYSPEMVESVIKPTKERMYSEGEMKKAIEFGCQQGHERGHINLIEEIRFFESLNTEGK